MRDRILKIMNHEGMNQQEFSRVTGIAPASLSSIFTGRTSPTLKHAEALHKRFPNLNMSWLLFGDGEMMAEDENSGESSLNTDDASAANMSPTSDGTSLFTPSIVKDQVVNQASAHNVPVLSTNSAEIGGLSPLQTTIPVEVLKNLNTKPRKIAEIRIFFDDGTFEVFKGNG